MSGLFAILLSLTLGSAGAPGALEREIEAARSEAALPLGFAVPLTDRVGLAFHANPSWSRAWFQATERSGRGVLALSIPHYLKGLRLRPIREMQPDTAEYLFHALLEARLETEAAAGGALAAEIRRRSEGFRSVPVEKRQQAFLDAAASFGSHVLSLYGEVARKERERRGRGESLCDALAGGAPLFRLWEAAFYRENHFPGSYGIPPPAGRGSAVTRWSEEGLGTEDRAWIVREILGASWTGTAEADLRSLVCPRSDLRR